MMRTKIPIPTIVLIFAVLVLYACGGGGGGGGGGGAQTSGCAWQNKNCGTRAAEGDYECSYNYLMKCVNGQWQTVIYCGSLTDSKGYSCTCKGGCGTSVVECSYAFNVCGGQQYINKADLLQWQ